MPHSLPKRTLGRQRRKPLSSPPKRMIMQERSRRLSQPLRWGLREKVAVAVVIGGLLIALVVLGVKGLNTASQNQAGCIKVTFASNVGGATIHACGAQARAICAAPGPYKGVAGLLREACRRAGYPYGHSPS